MIWSMEMSGVSYSLLRWAGSEEWASGQEPWEGLAYSEVFWFFLVFFLCCCSSVVFVPPPPTPPQYDTFSTIALDLSENLNKSF